MLGYGFDDDLAGECAGFADGALFLQAVGFGGLIERHDSVDARLEFAGSEPAVDVVGARRCSSGVALNIAKP